MSWIRRIRWRWVVVGGALWLTLLSCISLEDGQPQLAEWAAAASVGILMLAVLIGVLWLLSLPARACLRRLRRQTRSHRQRLQPRARAVRR